jgi:phage baseplate assembly protein gpV
VTYVRLLLVGALAAIGLVLPGAAGARSAAPPQPLTATVGDPAAPEAFRINLVDANGLKVTHVDPGTYTINVHDYATLHNFHLFGPGVNQSTDIPTPETTTWVVTFQDGARYHYECEAHPTQMFGSFTSGTVTTPPPPKKLKAQVGPGKRISLRTASGAKVKSVTAGTYKITVRDVTGADNFHLIGPGINKKTGVKAKTTVIWTVRFRSGPVRYRSDATKRLHGSFAVRAAG